jgi:phosphate/sulfate permease
VIKGFIGALIGGLVGAGLWSAVVFFTGYELGFIAWILGGLVGLGMAIGAGDDADTPTGVVAAIVAIGAIALGKFGAIHFLVNKEADKMYASQPAITIENGKLFMADQLVDEYAKAGKTLAWPDGMSQMDATAITDYPSDLQKDLETRWTSMTPAQHEEYVAFAQYARDEAFTAFKADVKDKVFKDSFGLFDIIWGILALITAFKVGSGLSGDD